MAINVPPPVIKDLGNIWEGSLDTALNWAGCLADLIFMIFLFLTLPLPIVAREVLNLDEYEFGKKASGTGPRTLLESQTGEHPLCYEPVDRLCLGANSWFVATSIPRHNLASESQLSLSKRAMIFFAVPRWSYVYEEQADLSVFSWQEMMRCPAIVKFLRPCHVGSISCGQSCGWGPHWCVQSR